MIKGVQILITTTTMETSPEERAKEEEAKRFILTEIASTFSEDRDFLTKINKITFGLISK